MQRFTYPADIQGYIESMRTAYVVYQFANERVVPVALSAGFLDLYGYKDLEHAYRSLSHDMYCHVHPDDVARLGNALMALDQGDAPLDVIYRLRPKGTEDYILVHATGFGTTSQDGLRLAQVTHTNEGAYDETVATTSLSHVMSNFVHEDAILQGSRYDFLTGLPNMTSLFQRAKVVRDDYLERSLVPVFLYLDLRGMKFFNKQHGFAEGDELLRAFARALSSTFGVQNSCRIGADQFAAFTIEDGLEETLDAFIDECATINGGKNLPVHIGIYSNAMGTVPVSTACDRAKFACDTIANYYESAYSYYDRNLRQDAVQRQHVLSNFNRALREHWIEVYYQPIVRAVNGHVCDEEALARWVDPELGMLSPAAFIPYLEDANQIYKLDLYVLDRVLEKIAIMEERRLHIVPQSINLSRSDFVSCDIVEEVRKRVDEAGVSRDKITVEITESTVGHDFEFMREQVLRFQRLGFGVWMDDFGSGYSSLVTLQSIRFDLIKFDMSFMRRLDEGDAGKVILTELMKLATSLGMDSICEGVETAEQVRFLQAIGCSKLQGYYFCRPIPLERVLERYDTGTQIGFEDPKESAYFSKMGKINLHDLSFFASEDESLHQSAFNTMPMGVMEYAPEGDGMRYVRSNDSFRAFMGQTFGFDLSDPMREYPTPEKGLGSVFMKKIKECGNNGDRVLIEEQTPDGSIINSFARRIDVNPVTGKVAVVIAILSINEPSDETTYASIARALATDFYNLYYVRLSNGDYIEYTSPIGAEDIAMERRGTGFFASAQKETLSRIYEEDQKPFLARFTRENIERELDEHGAFVAVYRVTDFGEPAYVRLKITRMHEDRDHIIIGISLIDAEMRQRKAQDKLHQEKVALGRIAALSANFIVLYTIDPETDHYIQYNPSTEFARFGLAKQGDDFFGDVKRDAPKAIDPKDMKRHLHVLTKENMMSEIRSRGHFIHRYRLLLEGGPTPVTLRATLVKEDDGDKIILGVSKD